MRRCVTHRLAPLAALHHAHLAARILAPHFSGDLLSLLPVVNQHQDFRLAAPFPNDDGIGHLLARLTRNARYSRTFAIASPNR